MKADSLVAKDANKTTSLFSAATSYNDEDGGSPE